MKRYFVLFFVVIMTFSLYACGQKLPDTSGASGTSSPNTEAGNPSSTTNTDTGSQDKQAGDVVVEITPPDGWTPVEGSVLPVHYMKGTASFMVKAEPFSKATLDDVVTEALGMYQKSFDNLNVQGEVEPYTVDEKDARKLTFTCTISKMNMKYVYVYLFAADKTYVITFGDLASSFDSLNDDYETILSSIRFKAQ